LDGKAHHCPKPPLPDIFFDGLEQIIGFVKKANAGMSVK
jgi:hypothetical protein